MCKTTSGLLYPVVDTGKCMSESSGGTPSWSVVGVSWWASWSWKRVCSVLRISRKRAELLHCLVQGCREDRPRLFSQAHCERMRGKRQVVMKNSKRSGLVTLSFFAFFPYNEDGQRQIGHRIWKAVDCPLERCTLLKQKMPEAALSNISWSCF